MAAGGMMGLMAWRLGMAGCAVGGRRDTAHSFVCAAQ